MYLTECDSILAKVMASTYTYTSIGLSRPTIHYPHLRSCLLQVHYTIMVYIVCDMSYHMLSTQAHICHSNAGHVFCTHNDTSQKACMSHVGHMHVTCRPHAYITCRPHACDMLLHSIYIPVKCCLLVGHMSFIWHRHACHNVAYMQITFHVVYMHVTCSYACHML